MPMNKRRKIWRTHKDRLFHRLFSEKENALSLYNALNGTNYGMEDGLKIVTLEDAIYLTMKMMWRYAYATVLIYGSSRAA